MLSNQRIESLKVHLEQKDNELTDALNRFSPLLELQMNREPIEEEKRARLTENLKGDISIL